MSRTGEYRRHQRERQRERTRKIVREWSAASIRPYEKELMERLVRTHEQNRRRCNCWMCKKEKYRDTRHLEVNQAW